MSNSQISNDNIFVKGYRLQVVQVDPNNPQDQRIVLKSIDTDGDVLTKEGSMQVLGAEEIMVLAHNLINICANQNNPNKKGENDELNVLIDDKLIKSYIQGKLLGSFGMDMNMNMKVVSRSNNASNASNASNTFTYPFADFEGLMLKSKVPLSNEISSRYFMDLFLCLNGDVLSDESRPKSEAIMGSCGLLFDHLLGKIDIQGVCVHKEFQGRGLCKIFMKKLLDYFFVLHKDIYFKIHEMSIACDVDNVAACKCYDGITHSAVHREVVISEGVKGYLFRRQIQREIKNVAPESRLLDYVGTMRSGWTPNDSLVAVPYQLIHNRNTMKLELRSVLERTDKWKKLDVNDILLMSMIYKKCKMMKNVNSMNSNVSNVSNVMSEEKMLRLLRPFIKTMIPFSTSLPKYEVMGQTNTNANVSQDELRHIDGIPDIMFKPSDVSFMVPYHLVVFFDTSLISQKDRNASVNSVNSVNSINSKNSASPIVGFCYMSINKDYGANEISDLCVLPEYMSRLSDFMYNMVMQYVYTDQHSTQELSVLCDEDLFKKYGGCDFLTVVPHIRVRFGFGFDYPQAFLYRAKKQNASNASNAANVTHVTNNAVNTSLSRKSNARTRSRTFSNANNNS